MKIEHWKPAFRNGCRSLSIAFPYTMKFLYFPHRIEVEYSSQNLMWQVLKIYVQFRKHYRSNPMKGNSPDPFNLILPECTADIISSGFVVSGRNLT